MNNLHSAAHCWNVEVFSQRCTVVGGSSNFLLPAFPLPSQVSGLYHGVLYHAYSLVLILHRFHLCNNILTLVTMVRKTLLGTFVIDINTIIIGRAQAQLLIQQRQLGIRANEQNEECQWIDNY